MDDKDKKISKLQAVIITLCTVIVGLASYTFYLSNAGDTATKQRCEYNGWAYTDGDSFLSIDGCNTCSCSDGEVFCTEMACVEDNSTCSSEEYCPN